MMLFTTTSNNKISFLLTVSVLLFHNTIMSFTLTHVFRTTSNKFFASSSSSISSESFQSKLNKFIKLSPAKININIPQTNIDRLGIVTEAKQ